MLDQRIVEVPSLVVKDLTTSLILSASITIVT